MGSAENTYDFDGEADSQDGLELEARAAGRAIVSELPFQLLRRELQWFYVRMRGRVPCALDASALHVAAASRVAGWLSELRPGHRGAFALRYDGRRWPVRLVRRFGGLTSVVVRFTATRRSRGPTETFAQAEQAAVAELLADIAAASRPADPTRRGAFDRGRAKKLRRLQLDAQKYVRCAERAYFHARRGAPCAIPGSREGA